VAKKSPVKKSNFAELGELTKAGLETCREKNWL
jgi:hypothetical protein